MAALGKWIDGITAESRVGDAAQLSLEVRLAAVAYWLPLAARQLDGDVEKVHQLRVSTRRAIAALKLYRNWLPRRPTRWLKRRLKSMRQAVGSARDLDVFAARLQQEYGAEADSLRTIVAERRVAVQPEIEVVADACLKNNRLHRKIGHLLDGVRPRGERAKSFDASFGDWATVRLREVAEPFFGIMPEVTADRTALHEFRIAGKRLRYTMELLAPALGVEFRREHYLVVEKLQERLGEINDCVTSTAHLNQWRHDLAAPDQKELLGRWIDQEQRRLETAIDAYSAWWTAERVDSLRLGLGITSADESSPPRVTTAGRSCVG
jgi:CHAD domain-containing protein